MCIRDSAGAAPGGRSSWREHREAAGSGDRGRLRPRADAPIPAARGLPVLAPRRAASWSGSSVRPRPRGGAAPARTRPTEASGGGGWKRGQAAGKGDDSSPGARIGNTAIWEEPCLGRREIREDGPSGEDLRPALAIPCLQPRS
ncbi:hypothetical protein NN561_013300 [Cricetulus griseus]